MRLPFIAMAIAWVAVCSAQTIVVDGVNTGLPTTRCGTDLTGNDRTFVVEKANTIVAECVIVGHNIMNAPQSDIGTTIDIIIDQRLNENPPLITIAMCTQGKLEEPFGGIYFAKGVNGVFGLSTGDVSNIPNAYPKSRAIMWMDNESAFGYNVESLNNGDAQCAHYFTLGWMTPDGTPEEYKLLVKNVIFHDYNLENAVGPWYPSYYSGVESNALTSFLMLIHLHFDFKSQ